jgi:preprotein translocase subunit SecG
MNSLITILLIIASILLVLIVLVQNSKGGGLVSNFSSSNQIMGVRKTADFLEKATWYLAIAMLVLSLAGSITLPRKGDNKQDLETAEQFNNTSTQSSSPLVVPPPAKKSTEKTNDK